MKYVCLVLAVKDFLNLYKIEQFNFLSVKPWHRHTVIIIRQELNWNTVSGSGWRTYDCEYCLRIRVKDVRPCILSQVQGEGRMTVNAVSGSGWRTYDFEYCLRIRVNLSQTGFDDWLDRGGGSEYTKPRYRGKCLCKLTRGIPLELLSWGIQAHSLGIQEWLDGCVIGLIKWLICWLIGWLYYGWWNDW